MLVELIDEIQKLNLDKKLYILIDEYDNFTNSILEGNGESFKNVVGNGGFIKAFYAVLKQYCQEGIVDRVFMTGICPIALNAMTIGFNISINITLDPRFNSMIGLTHDEVKYLISDVDEKDKEKIYNLMIEHYDGYLFNEDLSDDNRTFNATLVMYLLNYYNGFNNIPKNLLDTNIFGNNKKLDNILRLQHNQYYDEVLNDIIDNKEIVGNLNKEFDLDSDFEKDDIVSLLFYFGYLTIDRYDAIRKKYIWNTK